MNQSKKKDWRPAVNTKIRLVKGHPNTGQTGTVIAHAIYCGQPSIEIALDGGGRTGTIFPTFIAIEE